MASSATSASPMNQGMSLRCFCSIQTSATLSPSWVSVLGGSTLPIQDLCKERAV
jgi:hypothetical protein